MSTCLPRRWWRHNARTSASVSGGPFLQNTSLQSLCFFLSLQSFLSQQDLWQWWFLESSSYCLWLPVRIHALGEQTSGPTPVSLPPAPRTVCLLPSGYSEKKQEATFLSGGTREGFVGEEIFKERERHGEKSQRRMLKHSQRVVCMEPPPQALTEALSVPIRDSPCGQCRWVDGMIVHTAFHGTDPGCAKALWHAENAKKISKEFLKNF